MFVVVLEGVGDEPPEGIVLSEVTLRHHVLRSLTKNLFYLAYKIKYLQICQSKIP